MHDKATDVPPGYYLLFVLNDKGIPSRGKIVRINVAGGGSGGGNGGTDGVAPTKPTELSIALANGYPKLAWTASTDAVGVAGYSIFRSTNGTLGAEIALTPETSWTDATAQEGTTYTYGVRAYDAAGNLSKASALKSIKAFQNPTKPGNFMVALSNKKPKLSFSASTDNVGVTGYNVYRSTNGSLGPLLTQIAGSPWTDSSAVKGKTYTYAVRARDAAGNLSSATPLRTIKSN
jgi:fibronectin type 3 domain-containing protein